MTITDDSYGFARTAAWDSCAIHLSGCRNGYLLAICTTPLRSDCAEALQKSFRALGYGTDAVTYLVATDELLQTTELYRVVEAIDPGVMLATDDQANALLCQTYGIAVPAQPTARAGGRPFLPLPHMASLMERDEGRQKIWAALKTLPKLS